MHLFSLIIARFSDIHTKFWTVARTPILVFLTITGAGCIFAAPDSIPPQTPPLCIDSDFCAEAPTIPYNPDKVLTGYFVDAVAGSDNNSGITNAQAWRTVSRVSKANLPTGADIWFKSGQEWSEAITVDWNCTASNRCIIGTYWMNAGVETRGLPGGGDPGSPDSRQSSWKGATFEGTYPTGFSKVTKYAPLVRARTAYVTFENINCWKSNGACFEVSKDSGGHAIFDNVMAHISATVSYTSNRDIGSNEVKNSEFSKAASCWYDKLDGCDKTNTWSSCTKHIGVNNQNNRFHHNIVRECWGEGMGNSGRTRNNRIYDNIFIWTRSAVLYANGAQNIVFERNIVLGGAGQEAARPYFRNPSNTGNAAKLGFENSSYRASFSATGNIWRNNLFVGTGSCFSIGAESEAEADPDSVIGGAFIGNTCINADTYWHNAEGSAKHESMFRNPGAIIIQNNIFAKRNPLTARVGNCNESRAIKDGWITSSHNLTEEKWTDGDCYDVSDQENQLARFMRSTFSNPGPAQRYSFLDICIKASSDANDTGTNALDILTTDALGNSRSNQPDDIGAVTSRCL